MAKQAKAAAKAAGKYASADGRAWAFVGVVESVNVKGEGANSLQCVFSLIDRAGAHRSWVIEPAQVPHRFASMVQLLTAVAGSKIEVMLNEGPGVPTPYATELEIRPKTPKKRRKSK